MRHSFFNPLWRRISVVALCFAWASFEWLWGGSVVWGGIFFALGLVSAWVYLLSWEPQEPPE